MGKQGHENNPSPRDRAQLVGVFLQFISALVAVVSLLLIFPSYNKYLVSNGIIVATPIVACGFLLTIFSIWKYVGRKKLTVYLGTVAGLVLVMSGLVLGTVFRTPLFIHISYPTGGGVWFRTTVVGTSNVIGSMHIYVLIRPTSSDLWYAQESVAKIGEDGSWYVECHFGNNKTDVIGENFEIIAIVTSESISYYVASALPPQLLAQSEVVILTKTLAPN
jgi:hypothetical protein